MILKKSGLGHLREQLLTIGYELKPHIPFFPNPNRKDSLDPSSHSQERQSETDSKVEIQRRQRRLRTGGVERV